MTRSAPYYDGDFDEATQDGPIVPSVDAKNRARMWRQPMMQRASLWEPLDLDSDGPGDLPGFLIAESDPSAAGADLVKWDRFFSEMPATHYEPVGFAYEYQKTAATPEDPDATGLKTATVSTTANLKHEYFHTARPERIVLLRKKKFADLDELTFYLGVLTDPFAEIAAGDSIVERWRDSGNFWVRKTPYITKTTLLAALAETS